MSLAADAATGAAKPLWPPRALVLTILAAAALRAIVAGATDLTDDEAYYRLWAIAPAASYLDHPPMVGWLIALGRAIAGDTSLGIRLMAVLLPIAGGLALWRSTAILFDRGVADRATLFILVMPLLAVGGIIITPDTPSVMFWGLTGWAIAELAVSGRANWWLMVGLFAGLGLLSKYTNLFAGAGILLWLALPDNRHWFRTWQLWAGGALAMLLATPVIGWNVVHHGASFSKQFGRVGSGQGPTLKYLGELIGGYIGLAGPVLALFAVLGIIVLIGRLRTERPLPNGPVLLMVSVLPLLIFMLLQALNSRVQPNWLAPLYPSLAIFAALAIEQVTREAALRPRLVRLRDSAAPVSLALTGLLLVHAINPWVQLPGSRDPTSQMRGWAQFADALEQKRSSVGAQWIATDSYALTGQLAWHLRGRATVIQLNERLRYIHLPPAPDALLQQPALHISLDRNDQKDWLASRFATVEPLGSLERTSGGVSLATYVLSRVSGPKRPILDPP